MSHAFDVNNGDDSDSESDNECGEDEEITHFVNLVPRLFLREKKDPGRSWSRDAYKIDCLRGYGQSVKLRTLPLLDFTLPLQGRV